MSRITGRSGRFLLLLPLAAGSAGTLAAQGVITERPPTGTPTVVAAVTWVSSMVWRKGEVLLEWPAAAGASDYRVTRTDNSPGATEVTIFEGPAGNFVFEGKECVAGLAKKVRYTYRVWTGGGPSPVVSAKAW